jgi:hypothetical protein
MKKIKVTRKANKRQLKKVGDYFFTDGAVVMRCPVDGTLACISASNEILNENPLTISGPFQFPCKPSHRFAPSPLHAFTIKNGIMESSVYVGLERLPLKGFDK